MTIGGIESENEYGEKEMAALNNIDLNFRYIGKVKVQIICRL